MGSAAANQIVVITGAAGRIGRDVTPLLRREGRTLRLLDIVIPHADDRDGRDEWIAASITDRSALAAAFAGATAVIHLAGYAAERPWAEILDVNIDGAQAVLEASHAAGVQRVMLASSYHVVGYDVPAALREAEAMPPRPDTYYGVSKAVMEALGSVFADRFGMSVVSARLCSWGTRPVGARGLAQWLSTPDTARLIEAVVALDEPGHRIIWGVSDNAPGWFPLEPGHAIAFRPEDDAQRAIDSDDPDGRDPAVAPRVEDLELSSILGIGFVKPPHDLGVRIY